MAAARASIVPKLATLIIAAALAGCGQSNTYVAPPPPKVTVAKPVQRAVTIYLDATGNTAAVNTANLVARVPGFVQTINYEDGDLVKKGTLLFTIEPESYELKVKQSQAAQAGAQAAVKQTQADFERQSTLAAQGNASKAALDTSTANRDNAKANLQQAEINTKLAEINYGYTSVTAPFDGVVTARKVSIGDYVGANSTPTVLATIVQSDPIYVNFNVDEQDVIRIREQIRKRGLTPEDLKKVPVEVGLQTEEGYPHKGHLDYASPTVDSSTGTLAARAILDNPERVLLPGMFVRVRVPRSEMNKRFAGARQRARQRPERALSARRRQRQRGRAANGRDRTSSRARCGSSTRASNRTTASSSQACCARSPARRSIRTRRLTRPPRSNGRPP